MRESAVVESERGRQQANERYEADKAHQVEAAEALNKRIAQLEGRRAKAGGGIENKHSTDVESTNRVRTPV